MPIPSGVPLGLTPAQLNAAGASQWEQILRLSAEQIRCAIPGFLVSAIDPVTQTVTVQVALQERVRINNQTKAQWYDIPQIVHVPIMVPRGGGFAITLPLKKGDEGMLIFCDTCLDTWWLNGQNNAPPADNLQTLGASGPSGSQRQNEVRRHHIHDCGFYPGLWSQPNVLADYATDSLQIRTDDGTIVIDVSSIGVQITGGGTPLSLVTADWQTWFTNEVLPFLTSKGFAGPPQPTDSLTTILKGQ